MRAKVFHVYRNTPAGRETLLQAADFARKTKSELNVYLPDHQRFMFYFDADAVQVALDESYLLSPATQKANMERILQTFGVAPRLVYSTTKTSSVLPDVESEFDVISLPKIMTDVKRGIAGSHLGPGVRRLVKASHAPAIVSPGRYIDWSGIHVLFGGSSFAEKALRWGAVISATARVPLYLSTLLRGKPRDFYEEKVQQMGIRRNLIAAWHFYEDAEPIDLLFGVDRNHLLVMGAYGKRRLKKRLLGSMTELVLRNSANPILVVGEKCKDPIQE